MKRPFFFAAMLLVAVLSFQSCSGSKTKKSREEQRKPAPAVEEQKRAGTGTGEHKPAGPKTANQTSVTAPIPVKNRIPAALLAALPCKMEGKKGAFAVFPDNPAAGQICFSHYPARGNEPDIPKFDIQGGGMHIIFHYSAGSEPGEMKLMRWANRDGKPCLEAACGEEILVKREIYSAPGESGWTYIIITPEKPVDFASVTGGYYGLVMGAEKYIPLFQ